MRNSTILYWNKLFIYAAISQAINAKISVHEEKYKVKEIKITTFLKEKGYVLDKLNSEKSIFKSR
jgi:hypothetical protein